MEKYSYSFEAFMELAAASNHDWMRDQHWRSIFHHCTPCANEFDFVVQQESANEDQRHVSNIPVVFVSDPSLIIIFYFFFFYFFYLVFYFSYLYVFSVIILDVLIKLLNGFPVRFLYNRYSLQFQLFRLIFLAFFIVAIRK